MYSAVLDVEDFCRIKEEEEWKELRVMKDIEIFEDETAEVVEEAENCEIEED
ncbi:hypothetical protein B0F90DRAFT_1821329 [Multifurca ochricompacta]|uniref:Uncharacterized protein n=1 Tax=Multifurca ochricompacta TaxID=376703 RepID=A0AAD4LZB4_9AGAM|nr:hypothetical protein B0F90DRAFT_1821329 [Multifurca ochricompacta]